MDRRAYAVRGRPGRVVELVWVVEPGTEVAPAGPGVEGTRVAAVVACLRGARDDGWAAVAEAGGASIVVRHAFGADAGSPPDGLATDVRRCGDEVVPP